MVLKDDNELVSGVIQGNISSFEILIDRYQKTVFNIMLHMTGDMETAKDLSQNVFVKAFENLKSFRPEHRFFSWLYRIAVNEAIDWSRKSQQTVSLDMAQTLPAENPDPLDHEERSQYLHHAIRSLPPELRVLILLKYFSGLSYEGIAEVMSIPVEKVKSRLFSGRRQLRIELISVGFFTNE